MLNTRTWLIIQIGMEYEKMSLELIYIEKNEYRLKFSNSNLRSLQRNLIKNDRELKFRYFTVVSFKSFMVAKNVHQNFMASASTYLLLSICWNVDAIAKISMSKAFQYKICLQNDIIVGIFFPSCSFIGSAIRWRRRHQIYILCWMFKGENENKGTEEKKGSFWTVSRCCNKALYTL